MCCDEDCPSVCCEQETDNIMECVGTLDEDDVIKNFDLQRVVLEGAMKGTFDINELMEKLNDCPPLGFEWVLIKKQ